MNETDEPDDFEIQLAPGGAVDSPPPEFRHEVIDEVMVATGQIWNCICMSCPLAHWEVWADAPPAPAAPLDAPGTKGPPSRWTLEAYCRVRNAPVAKFEPDGEAPGKLRRASGTHLVFKCSDHKAAVERWQLEQIAG